MPRAKANGIELEYDTFGDPTDPPLVLIMGLGAQLIDWPPEFASQIAGHGFHVIRFDNRDSGLSTWLDELGVPDMMALLGGRAPRPTRWPTSATTPSGCWTRWASTRRTSSARRWAA